MDASVLARATGNACLFLSEGATLEKHDIPSTTFFPVSILTPRAFLSQEAIGDESHPDLRVGLNNQHRQGGLQ